MKALLPAAVLGPFLAAGLVRWWQVRRAARARERWILWIPVGGSVVVGFRSQLGPGRRALVLTGATVASYLAVTAVALVVTLAAGERTGESRYVVSAVAPGSPAAGWLASGDRLDALDGAPLRVEREPSLARRVADTGERPMRFDVIRGDRALSVEVTPRPDADTGQLRLGIELRIEELRDRPGALTAAGHALVVPARHAARMLRALWQNATSPPEERTDFMGPVGIADMLTRIDEPTRAFDVAVLSSVWLLLPVVLIDLCLLGGIAVLALRRARGSPGS